MMNNYLKFNYFSELWRYLTGYRSSRFKNLRIKLGSYQFTSPSLTILDDFKEDEDKVEDILSNCFIETPIMWQDMSYEAYKYCLDGFERLRDSCSEQIVHLNDMNRESDRFYRNLLQDMVNQVNDSLANLRTGGNISITRSLKYLQPDQSMIEEVSRLRSRTYSMIHYLIDLLPDSNKTKIRSLRYLKAGENVMTKIYRSGKTGDYEPELILSE